MNKLKRVDTLSERRKIQHELGDIGQHYICGCGSHLWILCANGDCVCANCLRAQVRIIVEELEPVRRK